MGQIGHTQVRLEDFMISSACAELHTHPAGLCVRHTDNLDDISYDFWISKIGSLDKFLHWLIMTKSGDQIRIPDIFSLREGEISLSWWQNLVQKLKRVP